MKFEELNPAYDIVIIGGGVTGAGVLHHAVNMGLKALLVEAKDFAWGTSSRSSKMVHGGLRYLKEGKFLLTRSAVRERQRLLSAYPGLVTPLSFIMPIYKKRGPSKTAMKAGLSIYSFMAGNRQHKFFDRDTTLETIAGIQMNDLVSAVGFKDAQVDDARLVLRLIFDACDHGGHALNYVRAEGIKRDSKGYVAAVQLKDAPTGREMEVKTKTVINATGAFAEKLHPSPVKGFHIRPLRGSHLVFPGNAYGLDRVISFIHPLDSRPVFIFPWEGCLVLGTTDVDHRAELSAEPCLDHQEAEYLMEGMRFILPDLPLSLDDAIASIAGVRPVLSKNKKAASKETREHVVWKDKGLVTVTGGKLTTFSLLAKDALKAAAPSLPETKPLELKTSVGTVSHLESLDDWDLTAEEQLRLLGRYGVRTERLGRAKSVLKPIGNTHTLWAELAHSARNEQVRHLEDLMLRRVRIGLFLPNGGMEIMDEIRTEVAPFINWDNEQWVKEIHEYQKLWEQSYSPKPWEIKHG